ncbi:hypothetical protein METBISCDRAFT_25336 [Metschnikowia bicuspidata]|uniref:Dolichyl-diphosphooligosaccharide-protein glycosyltransferase subunit OST5 n=1 Tax=Metschnikowia bicuspidata TaxID=27322 RepID=A0A4P9ZK12_9ASCO|nr:hypothetical protein METBISCDRAFT_25336 [Metschnikowia bicuspidata]
MSQAARIMKFNDLARDFIENSDAILPSKWNEYQALLTVLLALTSFISLTVTLLNRRAGLTKYLEGAAVASASIALLAIFACNFFAVYI